MFYRKIVELCTLRGKSLRKMCEECGIATASPTRWKNGSLPNMTTVYKIAKYFRVDPSYLTDDSVSNYDEWEMQFDPAPQKETAPQEDGLDDEFLALARQLSAAQVQRVKDFMRGMLS